MKDKIHPQYYANTKISCACGSSFVVGSTQPEIKVEICSACHPYYTGKGKLIDTAGRAERFTTRRTKAAATPKAEKKPRAKKQKVK